MSEVGNWATARVASTREDVGLWKTRNLRFLTREFGTPTYGENKHAGRCGDRRRTNRGRTGCTPKQVWGWHP
jgi:hypothetical protein